MVNLLTIFEKKQVLKEYKIRLAIVSLFMLASLIVMAIILLIPSYILSVEKYSNISKQLETEKLKMADISDKKNPLKITKDTNKKLNILKKVATSLPLPYYVITTIIKHKPRGISIDTVFYNRDISEEKITISGISENRETLISFLKSMELEKEFSKVELPISSFIKGENISFSMLVTIKEVTKKENDKK